MEFLEGEIIKQNDNYFILKVLNFGIKIFGNYKKIKNNIVYTFFEYNTHLNQMFIFGFSTIEEKKYFQQLIKIKGISSFSISKIMNKYSIDFIEKIRKNGNYLLLTETNIRPSILAKIVDKKIDNSISNIKWLVKTLQKYGFKKENILLAIKTIPNLNINIEILLPQIIRKINAYK